MISKKILLSSVVAACITLASTTVFAETVCSEVATPEQAETLMKRLFPESRILSTSPLQVAVSTSCLLEVEMLTIANDPKSTGLVYILPDGDHFLNGPLMSKRSWVGSTPQSQPVQASESQTTNQAISNPVPMAGKKPDSPAELRKNTLHRLQESPLFAFNYNEKPTATASVLFDVDCPYCIQQYKEMEVAAKEHNINFQWIPVYLNERSWAAAALLMRETQKDPEAAKKLLDDIMNKKISDDVLAAQFKTLTESDFAKAKETNMIFAEIVRSSRVGTPLTFVENGNGDVKVSSGKLELEEWKVML